MKINQIGIYGIALLLAGIMQESLATRRNLHHFTNNSDMRIQVSVLWHACDSDTHLVHFKGEKDKNGKELNNQYTFHGKLCCAKRFDFRDADANKFLQSNGRDLQIAIDNVDNKKAALAGEIIGGVIIGAGLGGAGFGVAKWSGEIIEGSLGVGSTGVGIVADAISLSNINPVIECDANSSWTFSGADGKYKLVGPKNYIWFIEVPATQMAQHIKQTHT